MKYTEETAQKAFELRFTYPLQEVAKMLNIPTREQVYRLLKKYGYPSTVKRRKTNIYTSLSSEDLAYLAGIVDGEGHVYSGGGILIVNTDKNLMDWLVKKLGGIYHIKKAVPGYKRSYYYRTNTYRGRELLSLIKPYLIIKANNIYWQSLDQVN